MTNGAAAPAGSAPRSEGTGSHVAIIVAARIVAGLVSAVIGLLVPRALSLDEYGHYGIVVGIVSVLVVLSDLGLTASFARYFAEGRATAPLAGRVAATRFAAACGAGLLLAGLGMVLQLGAGTAAGPGDGMMPAYFYLAGLLVVANSVLGVAVGMLPTLRHVRSLAVITILQPVLELAGIVTALELGYGAAGVIAGSTIAAAITGTAGMVIVGRGVVQHRRTATVAAPAAPANVTARTVQRYGAAMFLVALAFTAFSQVDQLVVYLLRGPTEAAGYIANWRLITLLQAPGLAAATVIAPRMSGGGAVASGQFWLWLRRLTVAYLGLVAVAATLAHELVPLALGAPYAPAAGLFVALAAYAVLYGVAPHITMAANFLGGARTRVRLGASTLAINIVLDLALVPVLGAYGAAIGTTVAFAWYVVGHTLLARRLLAAPGDVTARALVASWLLPVAWVIVAAGAAALATGTIHALSSDWLQGELGQTAGRLVAVVGSGALGILLYGLLVVAVRPAPRRRGPGAALPHERDDATGDEPVVAAPEEGAA